MDLSLVYQIGSTGKDSFAFEKANASIANMPKESATRLGLVSLVSNVSLAGIKMLVGFVGNSFALIADGIESLADVLSSVVVWSGLRVAAKEADHEHPYGHGKAEAIAALLAGVGLVASAIIIGYNAIHEIWIPHRMPAGFTIPVLIGIILAKQLLYLVMAKGSLKHDSPALKAEAWHHLSDSLTSLGVLAGLLFAVFAGPGFESADDVAALLVTGLILFNAIRIILPALDELMDRRVEDFRIQLIEDIAAGIEEIDRLETITVRRSGGEYVAEIHLEVHPEITVAKSHELAHQLKDKLLESPELKLTHAIMHVEPYYGNRSSDPAQKTSN
ncbi:MAG: cation diffusion facilitator family transporter [Verrucomicrobiae bacterium]|nr:cation diffusion facilitator family transporter [Verrucomicrobiae bacterium]